MLMVQCKAVAEKARVLTHGLVTVLRAALPAAVSLAAMTSRCQLIASEAWGLRFLKQRTAKVTKSCRSTVSTAPGSASRSSLFRFREGRPELLVYPAPRSKRERSLSRSRWLDVNALQLKHADLGRRTARRGKTTNLTAGQTLWQGMISATGFLAMA